MKPKDARNEKLQELCRGYLKRLSRIANKHGLGDFVKETINANKRGECRSTEYECQMLARLCDDERVQRVDVPKMLGKSYRQCNDDGDFDKIKKLRHVGIYSKVSALLFKESRRNGKRK